MSLSNMTTPEKGGRLQVPPNSTPRSSNRRSLASPRFPFSPGSPFKPNNDKREKSIRRSVMMKQREDQKIASSPFKSSPRKQQTREESLTSVQLTDLYSNCIKMCSENKINQKNSWELPLIDYIADVTSTRPGELTNFQMASVTLDASVKIYSCRVDSIHAEAYKVLGGMNRNDKKKSDNVEDVDGQRKKRSRHRAVNTLEANPDSLIVKKFDLEFDVDPMFKQMSAAFDEGGARGLLLNHLTTDKQGTLIFDSQEKDLGKEKSTSDVPDSAFSSLLSEWMCNVDATMENTVICPTLGNFTFMGWTPDVSEGTDAISSLNRSVFGESYKHQIADMSMHNLTVDMNVNGGTYDLNDSDVYDGGFADVFDDTVAPSMIEPKAITLQQASTIQKMGVVAANLANALTENTTDSEYSYFNEAAMKNWAGPSHWKFQKKASTNPQIDMNEDGDAKKKKKAKEKFYIDFEEDGFDWDSLLKTSRAATTLAKSTLKKSGDDYLLPYDAEYSIKSLTSLFTRPHLKVSSKKAASDDYLVAGDTWYDYDNLNDANNFCSAQDVNNHDNDDDDDDFDFDGGDFNADDGEPNSFEEGDGDAHLSNVMGKLNLIAEPTKAQKININYAKHAKRVNVRQVKSCIWKELKDGSSIDQQEEDEDENRHDNSVTTNSKKMMEEITQPHDFSKLCKDVPAMLSRNVGEQLSVPIMFVCLLHLANERTLSVSSTETMNDLIISQD
eukprot:m.16596 g.16596  ORF g.16596 m.16596 type:complete len:727 (-) comp4645_c1_seq1:161-2341(-)